MSSTRHSQDSALAGLHGNIAQASTMLEWLRVRLEVGRVSHSVQELNAEKTKLQKEMKKPPFYTEAAHHGQSVQVPAIVHGAIVWSAT